MGKIPDCDRCLLYTHQIYFVCTVHPEGVETEKWALSDRKMNQAETQGIGTSLNLR
jgi:hypothetical protein